MVVDRWMFIAMEIENRDKTKDKAEYLKSLFKNLHRLSDDRKTHSPNCWCWGQDANCTLNESEDKNE